MFPRAGGSRFACGLRSSGELACWGDGEAQSSPPSGEFTSVSAGTDTACGVRVDGTLACWGQNFFDVNTPPSGTFSSVDVGLDDDAVATDDDAVATDDDAVATDDDADADDDASAGAAGTATHDDGSPSAGAGGAGSSEATGAGGSRGGAGGTPSVAGGFGGEAGDGGDVLDTTSCGDGALDAGAEQCDDGNRLGGDGCTEACQLEADSYCPTAGSPCLSLSVCGNGTLTSREACDDGNTVGDDGCVADCSMVESGWQCRVPGQPCVPLCGDGIVIGLEQCDDGNRSSGDGCSSACRVEPNWSCTHAGSACSRAVCGNGVVETGESCDAGIQNGLFFGDASGCSKTCTREPSCRSAAGETVRCSTVCGDGNVDQGEGCDDGNLASGDGCSSTCQIEPGFLCTETVRSDATECQGGSGDCLLLPIRFRDFDGAQVSATGHPDFFYLGRNGVSCVPNASGAPAARTDGSGSNACWNSDATALCSGLVAAALGPSGKPVLSPDSAHTCACRFTDRDDTGVLSGASANTCTDTDGNAHTYVEDDVRVIESVESFAQWYSDSPKSTSALLLLELERDGNSDQFTFSSSAGKTIYDDLHDMFMGVGDTLVSTTAPGTTAQLAAIFSSHSRC